MGAETGDRAQGFRRGVGNVAKGAETESVQVLGTRVADTGKGSDGFSHGILAGNKLR
jgi:hypothetical protein